MWPVRKPFHSHPAQLPGLQWVNVPKGPHCSWPGWPLCCVHCVQSLPCSPQCTFCVQSLPCRAQCTHCVQSLLVVHSVHTVHIVYSHSPVVHSVQGTSLPSPPPSPTSPLSSAEIKNYLVKHKKGLRFRQ